MYYLVIDANGNIRRSSVYRFNAISMAGYFEADVFSVPTASPESIAGPRTCVFRGYYR